MTLNGLAFHYVTALEQWPVIPYLLPVPGFLLGLLLPNPGRYIARGPHWLVVLALILLLTLEQLAWLQMPAAVRADQFWLLPLGDVLSALIVGALLAQLGKARSRDAFGHTGWAFLQMLPLLNLPLLLSASREAPEGRQRMLSALDLPAAAVVVIGLSLALLNKGLSGFLESRLEPVIAQASQEGVFATNLLRYQIEAQGLAAMITEVAAGQPDPVQVEPGHRILKLTAEGGVLHVFHEIDEPGAEELDSSYRRALVSDTCDGLAWLLEAGGTVSRHFARKQDGLEFEVLNIRNGDCLV
ncbi:hypothetical protein MASR2M74_01120 [Paracoccaceae bacterium]